MTRRLTGSDVVAADGGAAPHRLSLRPGRHSGSVPRPRLSARAQDAVDGAIWDASAPHPPGAQAAPARSGG